MSMPSTDSQQRPTDNAPVGGAELFELAPVPQTWAVLGPEGQASAWQGNAAWHDLFDNEAPWLDPLAQIGFVRGLLVAGLPDGARVGPPRVVELVMRDRRGCERDMLVTGRLLRSAGHTGLMASYQDVSLQRATAMASVREYREMIESAKDSILLVENNRIIECNPAAELLFGRSREDLIGQHPGTLSPPYQEGGIPSMELAQRRIADALSGRRRRFLWRHVRPDGSEFTAEVVLNAAHNVPLEGGGASGRFVSVMRDVTDRLEAEQALKDSAERFQRLFELAPVALALLEPRGRVLAVNRQWTQLLGYTLDDVPDIPTWVALAYPDETYRNMALELWRHALSAVLEEGRELQPTEVMVRCKDGQTRNVLVGGAMVGKELMTSFVDVTAQRRAQAELEALNATLESRVQDRTQALQSAVDHLQRTQEELVRSEKLAGLGSLVAGVAHELNTPIGNAVMVSSTLRDLQRQFEVSVAEGLKRSTLQQFQAHWSEATEVIERNLRRAAELIASFKQVAVDQSSYQRRPFELGEVLHELQLTLSPTLRRSRVELIERVDGGLRMDSYPGPLTQVLMNLVNNAVVHAFDDRPLPHQVRIEGEALSDERVRITVADNGVGVDPAHLSRLFDPFFTTKLGRGGSGLGLHIVYTLVTGLLGGRVQVSSTPGQGCTVILELPCHAPQTAGTQESTAYHGG